MKLSMLRTVAWIMGILVVIWASLALMPVTQACSCDYFPPNDPACGDPTANPDGCYADHCDLCQNPKVCVEKQGGCKLAGSISVGGCGKDKLEPKLNSVGDLNRVGGPGGGFFTVGNSYSAALSTSTSGTYTNWGSWGTANDTVTPGDYGLVFDLESHSNPNLRRLNVSQFTASIPSFIHGATSPDETGTNLFSLRPEYNNDGEVDIATGSFTLRLHATLTNDHYDSSDPAIVVLDISGTIDPFAETITAEVDSIIYDPN